MIYLLKNSAETSASGSSTTAEVRRYSRHWTPVHIDFVVENIVTATERAIDAGAIQESDCVMWRGSTCVTFTDPYGHGFCLIEFSDDTYNNDLGS